MPRQPKRLYVPLDVAFFDDEKILRAGEKAAYLYLAIITKAKQLDTDGVLTKGQIAKIGIDTHRRRARHRAPHAARHLRHRVLAPLERVSRGAGPPTQGRPGTQGEGGSRTIQRQPLTIPLGFQPESERTHTGFRAESQRIRPDSVLKQNKQAEQAELSSP
jgi:hypothetical protein